MATAFIPAKEVYLFCRFCKKTLPAHLERGIAGSGRTIDKESTFEYRCSKCHRPNCFSGKDLIESTKNEDIQDEASESKSEPRNYNTSEHFMIGEEIVHPSYDTVGVIVGKEPGNPSQLLVKFNKTIVKFVENI